MPDQYADKHVPYAFVGTNPARPRATSCQLGCAASPVFKRKRGTGLPTLCQLLSSRDSAAGQGAEVPLC